MRLKLAMIVVAVVGTVAAVLLYSLAWSREATEIYRQRLVGLSREYETLRGRYNEAVRKTAVTELVVDKGRLSVAVRTIDGVSRVIPTSFDPSQEIYVDYVVLNGRLWIRRVFDGQTPPGKGLVIDPEKERIDWGGVPLVSHGKAVYRSLTEGRWVVTVTGDGSLGLKRASDADGPEAELAGPPEVRDYDEVHRQVTESIENITAGHVIKRILLGHDRHEVEGSR